MNVRSDVYDEYTRLLCDEYVPFIEIYELVVSTLGPGQNSMLQIVQARAKVRFHCDNPYESKYAQYVYSERCEIDALASPSTMRDYFMEDVMQRARLLLTEYYGGFYGRDPSKAIREDILKKWEVKATRSKKRARYASY